MFFLFILVGCRSGDTYEYYLNSDNYDELLSYEFYYHEASGDLGQVFECNVEFKLKDSDANANDLNIKYRVNYSPSFFSEKSYQEREVSFDNSDSVSDSFSISHVITNRISDLEIVEITGTVTTNVEHESLYRRVDLSHSDEAKAEFIEEMNKFNDVNDMTMTVKVINDAFENGSLDIVESIQYSPFYMSVIVDDEGVVIEEADDQYEIYEVSKSNFYKYYRLIESVKDLNDAEEAAQYSDEEVLSTELIDDWLFAHMDDQYVIQTTFFDFISILGDDSLGDAFSEAIDDFTLYLSFAFDENRIDILTYTIDETIPLNIAVTIEFGAIDKFDLSSYHMMPGESFDTATQTDLLTSGLTGQFYDYISSNYYYTYIDEGTYYFKTNRYLDINVYDDNQNLLSLENDSRYEVYGWYDDVYHFDAGYYYIEASIPYDNGDSFYNLKLANLENEYDDIGDYDHPEMITGDTYLLEIEGERDFVIACYDAPEGGALILTPETYDENLRVGIIRDDMSIQNIPSYSMEKSIYINLEPGKNYIVFSSLSGTNLSYDVLHYGVSALDDQMLSNEFPDDFVVTNETSRATYHFSLSTFSEVQFQFLYDIEVYGYSSFTIYKKNGYGSYDIKTSFDAYEMKRVVLEEGEYFIAFFENYGVKIKGHVVSNANQDVYDIDMLEINDINDINPLPDDEQSLTGFKGQIIKLNFNLEEDSFVYIDIYGLYEFKITDENMDEFSFLYHINYLKAGSYTLYLPQVENDIEMYSIIMGVVTDSMVTESNDEPWNLYQFLEISLNEQYTLAYDYPGDIEYLKFTTDESVYIDVSTSYYNNLYMVIDDGKILEVNLYRPLLLEPGTYYFLLKLNDALETYTFSFVEHLDQ